MPRPSSQASAGMRIVYGDEGTDPSTPLAGFRAIPLPPRKRDKFETTEVDAMDDDDPTLPDLFKYFEPGKADSGMFEPTLSFKQENVSLVYELDGVHKAYAIVLKSGAKWVFNAFIESIGPEANEKEEVLIKVGFQVNGKAKFIPAA